MVKLRARARWSRLKDKIAASLDGRQPLHFIHIGKNAGTQIAHIGAQINDSSKTYRFIKYRHTVGLDQIPQDEVYFFSVRNPISRFKSGFYSRKRKGQPRIFREWSVSERLAFERFEHANDLAEALFDPSEAGEVAYFAMRSVSHIARCQHVNFLTNGYFLETRPPAFIIRQEHFEDDLTQLQNRLELDVPVTLTKDKTAAHRNDYSSIPEFSTQAEDNLRRWYAADFEFYRTCENWISKQS